MAIKQPGWNWGPAWNGLRGDVNVLAWLFAEERALQRSYVEHLFSVATGTALTVDEYAEQCGFGVSAVVSADEHERPEKGALVADSESQSGH